MVILDTCFIIDLLRSKEPAIKIFDELEYKHEQFFIAAPTISELWLGALKAKAHQMEKRRIEGFMNGATIISFGTRSAKRAAEVEFELEQKNTIIDTEDIQIAATTLTHGETLVTRDAHFARID